jgi:DNA-binding CsgD family transcriptional regulator
MHIPFTIPSSDDARIFGRERERSGLGALLDQARGGAGSLVLIGGQAGIGKTTLAKDVERRAVERGMTVLTGYCYDLTATLPYSPWLQIARLSTRFAGTSPAPAVFANEPGLGQSQQMLFQELESLLISISEQQPLVLVLEDLHWADRESLAFLRWFGHQIAGLPILIAITYRDDELTRQHPLNEVLPALVRETGAHRINLKPLNDAAIRSLVASHYRLSEADEARLVAYLRDRADGNPFFLRELLLALEEEQRIYPTADAIWTISDLDRLSVPPLVRQVIDSRLNRLDDEVRAALEVAAVIGQNVPFALWSTISGMPSEGLAAVVSRAADVHLLEDARDGAHLRFPHALVRETVYEGLLLPRRLVLHHQVAEALMAGLGVAPDTVAHHLREAGDPRAIDWFMQAGIRAERVAWLTAAEHFKSVLRLMHEHDTDPAQRGWLLVRLARLLRHADPPQALAYLEEADDYAIDLADPLLAIYVTACRGEAHYYNGAGDIARFDVGSAAEALLTLSNADRQRLDELIAAGVTVDDSALIANFAAGYGQVGDIQAARTLAEHVLSTARTRCGEPPAEVPWALGLANALAGDSDEARLDFARAQRLFLSAHDYVMAGSTAFMDLVMAVLHYQTDDLPLRDRSVMAGKAAWNRARGAQGGFTVDVIEIPILVLEGRWSEVWPRLTAIQSSGMTASRKLYFSSLLVQVAQARGETQLAWNLIHQAIPSVRTADHPKLIFIGELRLLHVAASLAIDDGELELASEWLALADRWLTSSGAAFGLAELERLRTIWNRAAGDLDQAHASAIRALSCATNPRQPLDLLRAERLLGEVEAEMDDCDSAERHLRDSLSLADACRTRYEWALTAVALARLRLRAEAQDEAMRLISDARSIFKDLGAAPALRQLEALAAARTTLQPAFETAAGLTEREVDVLRLVAEGLTNAQVAEHLFVSRRTVDQHLRSIYGKLGVSSRAAATRFAVEQGLT